MATVNNSGRVEAISAGSAIITAHNSSGPNATCYVTVTPNSPTSLYLSTHQATINPGQTYSLNHTVYPTNVSYTIHWESNNTSVATVSAGTIYGVRSGHARITASIVGTSLYDTCHVTVRNIDPTSISIPHNMTILCGHSMTITPTVFPTGTNCSITWTSNNNSVASVNNGTIQGLSEGVALITARVTGTSLYDTCHVEVIPNRPTSISIPNTLVINVGQDTTLYPIIQPIGADCSLSWSTSNGHVATVNDGYIQGIDEGSTRITVRVSGLSLFDTC